MPVARHVGGLGGNAVQVAVQRLLVDGAQRDEIVAQPPAVLVDPGKSAGYVIFRHALGAYQQVTESHCFS